MFIIKFFRWLHDSVFLAIVISFFGLGGIALLVISYNFPEAIPILATDSVYRGWLMGFVVSLFLIVFVIDSIGSFLRSFFAIRSSTEKAKQDASYQFNNEQKQIVSQILAEKDKQKKKELEQQALILRQEYESLMSENLRRKDGTFVKDWREVLLVARKRLTDEEQRLLVRNRVNLRNGMFMALVGITLPVYYIFFFNEADANISVGKFFATYWPVFTIAAIIEIIAIFFLSLYASNERRLERNKNDLSNIELRLTAGLMLYDKTNGAKFAVLSDTLSKEESNVVLGKNESAGGISTDKVMGLLSKLILKGGN